MNPTCILVGNARMGEQLGDTIDSYNHVYRFNRFRIDGFESVVGTRCTHWILNNALTVDSRNYYVNNIDRVTNEHPEFISTMVITNKDNDLNKLNVIRDEYSNFDYYISDFKLDGKKMSTGTLAINYLLNTYSSISLVGFDFGKTPHYWGVHSQSDIPGKHSWELERAYVHEMESMGKVKIL